MKRIISMLLAVIMIVGIIPTFSFAADTTKPTVTVVNARTQLGEDSEQLRCSSLLEVKTSGFKAGASLTYVYSTTLVTRGDTELFIYSTPNMALATDNYKYEAEQDYNDKDTFSSEWKYFTLCGRKNGGTLVTASDLAGKKISVTVSDGTNTVTWTNTKDFKPCDLSKDMKNMTFGIFEGETAKLNNLLGLAGITHITCSNASVTGVSTADAKVATVSNGQLTGVKCGETTISVTVNKSSNCIMHSSQKCTETVKVKVFKKPVYSSTNTTITLTNLEAGLSYTINGVTKVATSSTQELTFTNLTPGTKYPVSVVAEYQGQKYTASIDATTTKMPYIHFMLDDVGVNPEKIYGQGVVIKDISYNYPNFSNYYDSVALDKNNGLYTVSLSGGSDSKRNVYYYLNNKYTLLHISPVTRNEIGDYYEKYYSVTYKLPNGFTATIPSTENYYIGTNVTVQALTNSSGTFKYWVDQNGKQYNVGDTISSINSKVVLTAVFAKYYDITYQAEGVDANNDNVPDNRTINRIENSTIVLNVNGGKYNGSTNPSNITLTKATTIAAPTKEKAIFSGWTKSESGTKITLTANYLDDKNENKIPDKFEVNLTFKVVNGKWSSGSTANITKIYALVDSNGKWSTSGSAKIPTGDIPTGMTPDDTHIGNGTWDNAIPASISSDSEFTYTFSTLKNHNITYAEYGKDVNNDNIPDNTTAAHRHGSHVTILPNGGSYTGTLTFDLTTDVTLNVPTKDKAVFVGWYKTVDGENISFLAKYLDDKDDNDIPDIYEVTLTFKVVNGTWSNSSAQNIEKKYTLVDGNGKWSESGSAKVPSSDVPVGMLPDAAHTSAGSWSEVVPSTIKKTSTLVYTYTFGTYKQYDVTYQEYNKDLNNDNIPDFTTDKFNHGTSIVIDPNGGTYTDPTNFTLTANTTINAPKKAKAVFVGWTKTVNNKTVTYKANYLDDQNENDIPDEYEVTVTFRVVNGTWANKSNKNIEKNYPLVDSNGKWDANGNATIPSGDIPVGMIPDGTHTNSGSWDNSIPAKVKKTSILTFTYKFGNDLMYDITYQMYGKDDNHDNIPDNAVSTQKVGKTVTVNPNGGTYSGTLSFTLNSNVTIPAANKTKAVFMGWTLTEDSTSVTLKANFLDDKDENSVPDIFEVTVTFKVVNGKWYNDSKKDITNKYTLVDEFGSWSENGNATIPTRDVPTGMLPDENHTAAGNWDVTPIPTSVSSSKTFTFSFNTLKMFNITYSEHGKDENKDNIPDEVTTTELINTNVVIDPNGGTYPGALTFVLKNNVKLDTPAKDKSVFTGWTKIVNNNTITFKANYETDEDESGVPDQYEVDLVFAVENGTWADKTSSAIVKSLVLVLVDEDGQWDVLGSARVENSMIPTGMLPDANHTAAGNWNTRIPNYITKDSKYTYKFSTLKQYDITYPEKDKDDNKDNIPDNTTITEDINTIVVVNPNGGNYPGELRFVLKGHVTLDTPTKDKAVFIGWTKDVDGNTITFTANYLDDTNSNNVPDIYEVKVTFNVANGTWSNKKNNTIVNYYPLCDEDGKWNTNGNAKIPAGDVPTGMIPDSNHTYAASWNVNKIPSTIDKDESFKYTFNTLKKFDITYPEKDKDENNDNIPDDVTITEDINTIVVIDPNGGNYPGELTFVLKGDVELQKPTKDKAVFVGWTSTKKDNTITFTANYVDDLNNNQIPDIYEVEVTFTVVNGTWADKSNSTITYNYALVDENGKWDENGSAKIPAIDVPTGMIPGSSYKANGAWNTSIPSYVKKDSAYEYKFSSEKIYNVVYQEYGKDENKDAIPDSVTTQLKHGTNIVIDPNGGNYPGELNFVLEGDLILETPTKQNAVFAGWEKIETPEKVTFKAHYDDDYVGDVDKDGNPISDGIADKYQVRVDYDPNGGTWADGTTAAKFTYVTLYKDGVLDVNGTGKLLLADGPKIKGKMLNGWKDELGNVNVPGYVVLINSDYKLVADYQEITDCPRDHTCPIEPFIDTLNNYWWHDGIHFCKEKGYMLGVEENLFDPNGNTTRGMIVAILWRIEGSPVVDGELSFTDVKSSRYYYNAIKWAQQTGVVKGYDEYSFGPEDFITREQMAAILYRYAKYVGADVSTTNDLGVYVDKKDISGYAVEAIAWANEAGLIKGYTENTIAPDDYTTRAMVAEIIWRYCNLIKITG